MVFGTKAKGTREFLSYVAPSRKDPKKYCTCCGEKIDERTFKDPLSLREYIISGMCQRCQDDMWDEDAYRG